MPHDRPGAPPPKSFSFHWPGALRLFLVLAVLFTAARLFYANFGLPEGSARLDAYRAVWQGVTVFLLAIFAPMIFRPNPPAAVRPLAWRMRLAAVFGVVVMFVHWFMIRTA